MQNKISPKNKISWRAEIYRFFTKNIFKFLNKNRKIVILDKDCNQKNVLWFHASSLGELEILRPVIIEFAKTGAPLGVTVFSQSAALGLDHLVTELMQNSCQLIFYGYSPFEGDWHRVVTQIKPKLFITARYEAWPELWISLSAHHTPFVVVAARLRRSLLLAKKILSFLGVKLPPLTFLTVTQDEITPLREHFLEAQFDFCGDPRWDRILERSKKPSEHALQLIQFSETLKSQEPLGVFGSVWPSDLKTLDGSLRMLAKQSSGQFWFFPHDVKLKSVNKILDILKNQGWKEIKLSSDLFLLKDELSKNFNSNFAQAIVVNEMGCLAEFYKKASWVYVGGGFEAGIHSTMEPALYGIPISSGTKRALSFSEVTFLTQTGQLTLLHQDEDFLNWLKSLALLRSKHEMWKQDVIEQFGATSKVVSKINSM